MKKHIPAQPVKVLKLKEEVQDEERLSITVQIVVSGSRSGEGEILLT